MNWFIGNVPWLVFIVLFAGFLFYSRYRRQQDLGWVKDRFGDRESVITSFAVTFYGRALDPVPIRKQKGFLILFDDLICFRPRSGDEWSVSAEKLRWVDHDTTLAGRDLNQSVMVVDYENDTGEIDRAAFRVPYPPQWIRAIKTTCLGMEPPPAK